jgi:hypothetical protein
VIYLSDHLHQIVHRSEPDRSYVIGQRNAASAHPQFHFGSAFERAFRHVDRHEPRGTVRYYAHRIYRFLAAAADHKYPLTFEVVLGH